ncbi:hypothetical protein KY084_05400 [Stakelama sp. CBK3Z-3]|uniref:Type II secretion system protein GspC N-terminal domain-containing protein n=1 Tax=Stakelama flava TaxID=2860338 RepID=A0ABS6XJC1_9SPHN|nr:hypothetical protein [Stakelama flava]MBW4330307.1 hypothetical protein [Stakelama flava]
MARLTRPESIALGLALLAAIGVPLALSFGTMSAQRSSGPSDLTTKLSPRAPPEIGALYSRPLFAPARFDNQDETPADAPKLVGIAGRINGDAVALVRGVDGTSRALGPGDSIDGWRLVSLAADSAYFERGREQVRVAVPAPSDDAEADQ